MQGFELGEIPGEMKTHFTRDTWFSGYSVTQYGHVGMLAADQWNLSDLGHLYSNFTDFSYFSVISDELKMA